MIADVVYRAACYAIAAHAKQTRKYTGEAYIVHPMAVVKILETYGGAYHADLLAAAWLHDVIEDCGVKAAWLHAEFGGAVTRFVLEATDVYTKEAYPALNRAERKRCETARLYDIQPLTRLLKLADIVDNARSIRQHDAGFAPVYCAEMEALLRGPLAINRLERGFGWDVLWRLAATAVGLPT